MPPLCLLLQEVQTNRVKLVPGCSIGAILQNDIPDRDTIVLLGKQPPEFRVGVVAACEGMGLWCMECENDAIYLLTPASKICTGGNKADALIFIHSRRACCCGGDGDANSGTTNDICDSYQQSQGDKRGLE
jgi:hypothetical protein